MPVGKVICHWVSEVKWEVGSNRIETSDQKNPKLNNLYIFPYWSKTNISEIAF